MIKSIISHYANMFDRYIDLQIFDNEDPIILSISLSNNDRNGMDVYLTSNEIEELIDSLELMKNRIKVLENEKWKVKNSVNDRVQRVEE